MCQCVAYHWTISHPCTQLFVLHMVGRLRHRSSGCTHQPTTALRFWATPLKDTTQMLRWCLMPSRSWCRQTPLHNLQNPESPEHLSKLLHLPQASLTPLSCEGCPHGSALWLSPVLSVPGISSTVKRRLAGPFRLHQLFKLPLKQHNKITPSTHVSNSWHFKLYQS